MNLRILKKLSKRAAPFLNALGDDRKQFRAERWENYISVLIPARKHWERTRCHPSYDGRNDFMSARGAERLFKTADGRTMVMKPPSYARKGTMMVGGMSGYYEPEWDEQSAWEALTEFVFNHFTDYSEDGPSITREFRSPADFFRAAAEIIAEGKSGRSLEAFPCPT